MENYSDAYRREAQENLEELEYALLELEKKTNDPELINLVFRKYHTIKGSGAMFGFNDIARFTHEIETVYDHVRDGKIAISKNLINLSLAACDIIEKMIKGDSVTPDECADIVSQFAAMLPEASVRHSSQNHHPADSFQSPGKNLNNYLIRFKPASHLFTNGTNPILLLEELKRMGECSIVANPREIPPLKELSPTVCYLSWDIILTTAFEFDDIRDVFIFTEDQCELTIKLIDTPDDCVETGSYKKLGEILLARGKLSEKDLEEALSCQKRLGEVLVERKAVDAEEVLSALKEQEHVSRFKKRQEENVTASSIRVPADRLDALLNLVGELVTVQARLSEESSRYRRSNIAYISEEIERLVGELRDKTMSIRMLPIGTLFTKFKRVVRDLSEELGKRIELTTEGGETELDKRMIELLNDPLVHLIRNSIDHGVESPQAREQSGKPAEGRLALKAIHSGDNVLITIEDDGAGLNAEAIRMKAVAKGLISKDVKLPDEELFPLIFAPGFSTAAQITGVSGRGVGMDVVKKSVEALQGSVSVRSQKGLGTQITLKVPLTLAIVDGLMVKVGDGDFVFPLATVEECVEITRKEADLAKKRRMMELRGKMVRYMHLSDYFDTSSKKPAFEKIVVVDVNGKKVGLGVDSVVGKLQAVIKSIGDVYKEIEGLSGATIKGDGTIALVLDVNSLSRSTSLSSENCV